MTFKKYYDKWIHEWIDDEDIDREIEEIYKMSLEELVKRKDDYITETYLDSSYEQSYEGKVIGKTIIKAIRDANKRGEVIIKCEPISLLGCMSAFMEGVIIGDEYVRRIKGT